MNIPCNPCYITREELEDAKKELVDLRGRKAEVVESIEKEKRERDEALCLISEKNKIVFNTLLLIKRL